METAEAWKFSWSWVEADASYQNWEYKKRNGFREKKNFTSEMTSLLIKGSCGRVFQDVTFMRPKLGECLVTRLRFREAVAYVAVL